LFLTCAALVQKQLASQVESIQKNFAPQQNHADATLNSAVFDARLDDRHRIGFRVEKSTVAQFLWY
jgi:hypothetical protein